MCLLGRINKINTKYYEKEANGHLPDNGREYQRL
jgi:hypothetical protein